MLGGVYNVQRQIVPLSFLSLDHPILLDKDCMKVVNQRTHERRAYRDTELWDTNLIRNYGASFKRSISHNIFALIATVNSENERTDDDNDADSEAPSSSAKRMSPKPKYSQISLLVAIVISYSSKRYFWNSPAPLPGPI